MKYRKKPVVIDAWRTAIGEELPPGAQIRRMVSPSGSSPPQWEVYDELHQTWVKFGIGDWIIKGVKGEFYPCESETFAATYEPAPSAPPPASKEGE